jgi:hypothetical protein
MHIAGTAQLAAWQRGELRSVKQLREDLWSLPEPVPNNPLR